MRRLLLTTLFLLLPGIVQSQTPSFKMIWNHTEPPAVSQAFQFTLKVDSGTPAIITATCTANGTGSTCTAPLTALPSGPHTLTLTAFDGFGSSSATLAGQPPSTPVSVTVTVTITIP